MYDFTRRSFLAGLSSAALAPKLAMAKAGTTLKSAAARCGIPFGTEVSAPHVKGEPAIGEDPAYDRLVVEEAALLVSNTAMKWGYMDWDGLGKTSYWAGDQLVRFAHSHGLKVRGHNLIWHRWLPPWFPKHPDPEELRALMKRRVLDTVRHWRGKLTSWDVVNEALYPSDGLLHGLTRSVFSETLGLDYVELPFKWARQADPDVVLVYNDADFEYGRRGARRRAALLRLIEGFRKRGIPCDAVGLQSHLVAAEPGFDERGYRRFLGEIAAMGYGIKITELDVRDNRFGKSYPYRAAKCADEVGRYLDVALDEKAVDTVLTWGLTTKYSWLNRDSFVRRKDSARTTGTPFDADLKPTPMYWRMVRSFRHAPSR